MRVEIRPLGTADEHAVLTARSLFDHEPDIDATRRFLAEPTHHLLVAYDPAGEPLGFGSGVETTHPDKGTEMFLMRSESASPRAARASGGRSSRRSPRSPRSAAATTCGRARTPTTLQRAQLRYEPGP